MTVLGRGLVFQPVLVTQTYTYNSNNIITLQNIYITDFPSKHFFLKNIPTPLPLPKKPQTHNNNNRRSHDTSECFDIEQATRKKMTKVKIK